ncbi:MAG: peptidylprolyl isomerase [Pseudohongiella sp.]
MCSTTYTLAPLEDIKRRFGDEFTHQLSTLRRGQWTGPVSSGYGGHLVLITDFIPGRL